MGTQQDPTVINLEPSIDPVTGREVFAAPVPVITTLPGDDIEPGRFDGGTQDPPMIRKGAVVAADQAADPDSGVSLTGERFSSGYGDEFAAIERAQDAGEEVRIVNGQFVTGSGSAAQSAEGVGLTDKRFSAMSATEIAEVRNLATSGAAGRYVNSLRPASDMPEYFPNGAAGIYLHTKPTKYGDELHVVIKRNPSTSLYEAHLWAFTRRQGSRTERIDLGLWVGTPNNSAHHYHLYPGSNGSGGVLCLSTDTNGGMPSLASCVVRCAQWAVGMGEVVRGRPFPYRE